MHVESNGHIFRDNVFGRCWRKLCAAPRICIPYDPCLEASLGVLGVTICVCHYLWI